MKLSINRSIINRFGKSLDNLAELVADISGTEPDFMPSKKMKQDLESREVYTSKALKVNTTDKEVIVTLNDGLISDMLDVVDNTYRYVAPLVPGFIAVGNYYNKAMAKLAEKWELQD